MKALIATLALALMTQDTIPPKGYVCMGYVKPEAQALADGDSYGEQLVINTRLTESEKRRLYYARQKEEAAMKEESAVEESILANHQLLFPTTGGSDWMRTDSCGEMPMIRSGEYHVTQFVPSNPNYPSDSRLDMERSLGTALQSAASCRAHFAEQRKHAVKATYVVNDEFTPR